jgi:hypothetical protein
LVSVQRVEEHLELSLVRMIGGLYAA